MNKKKSSQGIAKLASETLKDKQASKAKKSLAGSALSQVNKKHQTGSKMEDFASSVLQSKKYGKDTKSLAASVLSQSNKKR